MSGDLNAVTVLTRFHTIQRLDLLDEALFSLLGQNGVHVRSRILCQSLEEGEFARVVAMCQVYEKLGLDVSATNEHFDDDADHRSELLNRGMARLETRYLAFLDCDDVVYPSCYIRLIERIEATGSALAFTGVKICEYFRESKNVFAKSKYLGFGNAPKAQFFIQNQYPIHSFVVDVSRVDPVDLYFDTDAARNEDYAFLFRLLRKYQFDTNEFNRPNCEYRLNIDGDNTVSVFDVASDSSKNGVTQKNIWIASGRSNPSRSTSRISRISSRITRIFPRRKRRQSLPRKRAESRNTPWFAGLRHRKTDG